MNLFFVNNFWDKKIAEVCYKSSVVKISKKEERIVWFIVGWQVIQQLEHCLEIMKYLLLVFFDGEEVIAYKTLVSYENDQSVLIDHQDIKRRRDIVKSKMGWVSSLWWYEKELDAQLAEAKMKAAAEAEIKAKAEFVLKLLSKYLNEDTQWLENLTEYQYDQIFKKLIEDASLEEIKKIIGD